MLCLSHGWSAIMFYALEAAGRMYLGTIDIKEDPPLKKPSTLTNTSVPGTPGLALDPTSEGPQSSSGHQQKQTKEKKNWPRKLHSKCSIGCNCLQNPDKRRE